jgi:hypothetical protein
MKLMRGGPRWCGRGAARLWLPVGMLAMLLQAGCGMFDSAPAVSPPGQPILPSAGAPVPGNPQETCERRANSDPAVQDLRMRQLAGGVGPNGYQTQIEQATKQAVNRCLASLGRGRPGGVQPLNQ